MFELRGELAASGITSVSSLCNPWGRLRWHSLDVNLPTSRMARTSTCYCKAVHETVCGCSHTLDGQIGSRCLVEHISCFFAAFVEAFPFLPRSLLTGWAVTMSDMKLSYQALRASDQNTQNSNVSRSLWKILPWTGLGSLLLALCCGIAALITGLISNGVSQNSWHLSTGVVQPSVLLSLAATLANALLRIAFAQGAATTWWVQARGVIDIGKLIALHEHTSALQCLSTFSGFSRITLATAAMLVLLADGPLLQRAITTQLIHPANISEVTIPISPSPFNLGATGVFTETGSSLPNLYASAFAQVVREYDSRKPISISSLEQNGTVSMDMLAPGWDINCENGSSRYHIMELDEAKSDDSSSAYIQPMFNISVVWDNTPRILLNTSYKSTTGMDGTKTWRQCNLTEAITRYSLRIDDGIVSMQPSPLSQNRTEHIIERDIEFAVDGGKFAIRHHEGSI